MCGIVGAMGNIFVQQESMVEWLLRLDTSRGPHSTGLLSANKGNGQVTIVKCIGTPWELFSTKRYEDLMRKQHKVLIGHNRWATTGAITSRNAHPFQHKHIAGVHNGTLKDQTLLDDHKRFEVDSDNIFHHISKHGIEETVPKIHGAYCLVWFDETTQTVNLIRNSERPLYITHDEAKTCLFWASENWMLNVAAAKASIRIVNPMLLPVDTLLSVRATKTGFDEVEGSGKVLKGFVPKYTTYNYGNGYAPNNKNFIKEKIFFEVLGEVNSEYGAKMFSHTLCEVVQGSRKGDKVKCYISLNPTLRKQMLDSVNVFSADITCTFSEHNKITNKWDDIHQVDVGSIKEEKPTPFNKNIKKLVSGVLLSEQEFNKKCEAGCSWCTDIPKFSVADKVLFNRSHTEFLCETCNVPANRIYFDYDEVAST